MEGYGSILLAQGLRDNRPPGHFDTVVFDAETTFIYGYKTW